MGRRGLLGPAAVVAVLLAGHPLRAQTPQTPPPNGPRRIDPAWHALTGATVHVGPATVREKATVVVREGRIVSVSAGPAPPGARVWDCAGRHVYAGFIDAYVEVDAPLPDPKTPGRHWNRGVTPERSALDGKGLDPKTAEALRKMGFCAAAISPKGGVFRGRAALVSLAAPDPDPSRPRPPLYADGVYGAVAFETAPRDEARYPTSQMGAIALIRQTLLDADRRRMPGGDGGPDPRPPPSALDALGPGTPLLFDTADELEALRAARIGTEFGRRSILLGSGLEFRRLPAVAAAWSDVVVPLRFPEPPPVSSVGEADAVDLRTLMTWEQAPTNPRRLAAAGLRVSLTTSRLEQRPKFLEHLRTALRHGLGPDDALAMLTTRPAALLGVTDRLGTVEPGKIADLVVCDGPVFAKKTKVLDVWIDGRRHEIHPPPEPELEGEWTITLDPPVEGDRGLKIGSGPEITVRAGDRTVKARDVRYADRRLHFVFDHTDFGEAGFFTMSAVLEGGVLRGHGVRASGRRFGWTATRRPGSGGEQEPAEEEETAP
ncbi:MAG: amidohydrolase family protein, partial [Planctomycetota bacterium]